MPHDVQLAQKIIAKARELFAKDYSYIVDCPAAIHFQEEGDAFILENITFTAEGAYQDEIAISLYSGPVITLEEGLFEQLADCESLEQFLELEESSLNPLPDYFVERVSVAQKMK